MSNNCMNNITGSISTVPSSMYTGLYTTTAIPSTIYSPADNVYFQVLAYLNESEIDNMLHAACDRGGLAAVSSMLLAMFGLRHFTEAFLLEWYNALVPNGTVSKEMFRNALQPLHGPDMRCGGYPKLTLLLMLE